MLYSYGKGKAHIQLILEKIFSAAEKRLRKHLNGLRLDHIVKLRKKNAMVFLISDFIDDSFEQNLSAVCADYAMLLRCVCLMHVERNFPVSWINYGARY